MEPAVIVEQNDEPVTEDQPIDPKQLTELPVSPKQSASLSQSFSQLVPSDQSVRGCQSTPNHLQAPPPSW
ncbi:hypothetical protein N7520_008860 [Penicillium odoratum]|uniref:uncharacterized protein n=1 Tax=Penicillium odoratum TaxID=1167516 RepID=UPI002547EF42|nr:uncharacterized protein N7520_008860 [Penicillium odoratum]KAJ5751943.1 hypothetical protein N7520_008860 [Penicillium odoratum]